MKHAGWLCFGDGHTFLCEDCLCGETQKLWRNWERSVYEKDMYVFSLHLETHRQDDEAAGLRII